MSTTPLEKDRVFPFDSIFFHEQINRVIEATTPLFFRLIKTHVVFHLFFISLITIQIVLLLFFATDLVKNSLLGICLAVLFLTVFSYFTLRLYAQTKKSRQFEQVEFNFISTCHDLIHFKEGCPEHRLALANACTKFATALEGKQEQVWRCLAWLETFRPSVESFSFWWHWHDIFAMRERLLTTAVNEHLELVKMEPTDLPVHAALANAYVTLSTIYLNPYSEEERKLPRKADRIEVEKRFRRTAERAIEEFKIINDFAPDNPWVHLQLAYSYRDLGMPEEEIREYEIVIRLAPEDDETLFRLGMLYFHQGHNANGLKIYEALRSFHPAKADHLILHYGGLNII